MATSLVEYARVLPVRKAESSAYDLVTLVDGLLDLFEASGEQGWVKWADELQGE